MTRETPESPSPQESAAKTSVIKVTEAAAAQMPMDATPEQIVQNLESESNQWPASTEKGSNFIEFISHLAFKAICVERVMVHFPDSQGAEWAKNLINWDPLEADMKWRIPFNYFFYLAEQNEDSQSIFWRNFGTMWPYFERLLIAASRLDAYSPILQSTRDDNLPVRAFTAALRSLTSEFALVIRSRGGLIDTPRILTPVSATLPAGITVDLNRCEGFLAYGAGTRLPARKMYDFLKLRCSELGADTIVTDVLQWGWSSPEGRKRRTILVQYQEDAWLTALGSSR